MVGKYRNDKTKSVDTRSRTIFFFLFFFSVVAARYSPLPGQATDVCVIFSLPTSAGLEDVLTTADISPHVALSDVCCSLTFATPCFT